MPHWLRTASARCSAGDVFLWRHGLQHASSSQFRSVFQVFIRVSSIDVSIRRSNCALHRSVIQPVLQCDISRKSSGFGNRLACVTAPVCKCDEIEKLDDADPLSQIPKPHKQSPNLLQARCFHCKRCTVALNGRDWPAASLLASACSRLSHVAIALGFTGCRLCRSLLLLADDKVTLQPCKHRLRLDRLLPLLQPTPRCILP